MIQPGTAGADVHRQREGLALQGAGGAGAARAQGAGARRHRGHQDRHGPAAQPASRRRASRSATRPARPTWWPPTTGAVVGVAWRSFDETGVVAAPAVVVAAGGFVMNPDMVAEHTPALGSKLFTLGSTYDDGLGIRLGAVGRRGAQAHGRAVHHRAGLPAVGAGDRAHRQRAGRAVRRRGLLPLADLAVRDGAAGLRGVPHHRQRARASTRRCRWCRSSTATRRSPRSRPRSASRRDRWQKTLARYNEHAAVGEDPDFHKSPRLAGLAGRRPVGGLRPAPRQGALRRLHARRHPGVGRRRGAAARRLRRTAASTPPAPAPPTSPRTARATAPAPSSVRGRSSAVGPGGTRPQVYPADWVSRASRALQRLAMRQFPRRPGNLRAA